MHDVVRPVAEHRGEGPGRAAAPELPTDGTAEEHCQVLDRLPADCADLMHTENVLH